MHESTGFVFPPPPALPTLLRYVCTTVAQYTTPLPPPLCMPYTKYWSWQYRVKVKTQSGLPRLYPLSRAVHQESSCPAHAHRARASCLPDSNPYGRDGLAHSRSLSPPRGALCVSPKSMSLLLLTGYIRKVGFQPN